MQNAAVERRTGSCSSWVSQRINILLGFRPCALFSFHYYYTTSVLYFPIRITFNDATCRRAFARFHWMSDPKGKKNIFPSPFILNNKEKLNRVRDVHTQLQSTTNDKIHFSMEFYFCVANQEDITSSFHSQSAECQTNRWVRKLCSNTSDDNKWSKIK